MDQVRVGVAVFVCNEKGDILIGHRRGSHGSGQWGLPGGHLEPGETPENCAIREAQEEAGIKVGNAVPLGFSNDIFESGKHYITLFMKADHLSGAVRVCEPEKNEEWRWASLDNLPRPLFLPLENFLAGPFRGNIDTDRRDKKSAA